MPKRAASGPIEISCKRERLRDISDMAVAAVCRGIFGQWWYIAPLDVRCAREQQAMAILLREMD